MKTSEMDIELSDSKIEWELNSFFYDLADQSEFERFESAVRFIKNKSHLISKLKIKSITSFISQLELSRINEGQILAQITSIKNDNITQEDVLESIEKFEISDEIFINRVLINFLSHKPKYKIEDFNNILTILQRFKCYNLSIKDNVVDLFLKKIDKELDLEDVEDLSQMVENKKLENKDLINKKIHFYYLKHKKDGISIKDYQNLYWSKDNEDHNVNQIITILDLTNENSLNVDNFLTLTNIAQIQDDQNKQEIIKRFIKKVTRINKEDLQQIIQELKITDEEVKIDLISDFIVKKDGALTLDEALSLIN